MKNHPPAFGSLLENVRGQNCGENVLTLNGAGQIFIECYPCHASSNLDRDLGQHETDRRRVFENPPPALHDRIPASQNPPSRVAALDVTLPRPDLLHLLEVEAFEGAVEVFVRLSDFLLVGLHNASNGPASA